MKFKPSILEQCIATLPEDLQIDALNAVKEEYDRWDRGDLTPEELAFQEKVKILGDNAAKTKERIAFKVFSHDH